MKIRFLILLLSFLIAAPAFAKNHGAMRRDLHRAEQKMKAGEYEAAEKLYKKALEIDDENESALLGLGDSYYWQGDYSKAVQTFDRLLKKNPDHVAALNKQGKTYLALGDETKARRAFEHARRIDPDSSEAETLGEQVTRQVRVRVMGGYRNESLNYASDTHGEFQDIGIEVEKFFKVGIRNSYVRRFDKEVLDNAIYGYYYPLRDTRLSLRLSSAGKVSILPRQSYQLGVAQHIGRWRPEISYLFQDFQEADTHGLTASLTVNPIQSLEIGGGYKFQSLKTSGRDDEFHGGFARLRLGTPFQSISFNALYEFGRNGFEAGRPPSPFVNYKSHLYGGGISISLPQSYAIDFSLFREDRNNGEQSAISSLSLGYSF